MSGANSLALGNSLTVSGTNTVASNSGADAVKYDSSKHDKVTLGGTSATAPVALTNVAAGKDATDAVNVSQLSSLGAKLDTNGNVTNAFVAYDDASKGAVTLGGSNGTQIHNVAAATADKDAVNLAQLKEIGAKIDTNGNVTNAFVAYDDASKGAVTLGGSDGTQIHNVAAGAATKDAVNVGQLEAVGAKLDTNGNVTNAFVAYDDASKGAVTLGGSNGTQIHNVAAATADKDAVNLAQLKEIGAKFDTNGNVTNAFVAYDDASKGAVTLGGSDGTQIHNVAAGTATKDAVNVGQLEAVGAKLDTNGNVTNAFVAYDDASKGTVTLGGSNGTKITNVTAGALTATSKDAVNGSQLNSVGSTTAAALGGGATFDPATGKVTTPTYTVDGKTYGDVGSALGAVASNSGADAVKYDSSTHDKVTLGGTSATAPVALTNVAAGKTDHDAVNFSQLQALGGTFDSNGVPTNAFVAYDDATKGKITLGGKGSTTPVKLTNVADGVDASDAATVGQVNSLANNFTAVQTSLKYIRFGATNAATGQATGTDSVSIGGNAFATATGALAIGRDAAAGFVNSVAIGIKSATNAADTVSFGNATYQRRLTNVAAGTGATDAVNLGQVQQLIAGAATTPATMSAQLATRSLLAATIPVPVSSLQPNQLIVSGPTDKGGQVEALGSDSMAVGLNVHANGNQSVAIGTNSSAANVGSVAIGNSAISSSDGGTAIGVNAQATNAKNALAVGNFAQAGSTNSIVVGNNSIVADTASTTTDNGISLGNNNVVSGANSLALGNNLTVSGTNTAVLGNNIANATGKNSVVLGAGSDGSMDNVVSVGAKGAERKVVNVATGTAATDAVNVAQLNAAVANAGGGDSLVKQDPTTSAITVAAATGGKSVDFTGTAGPRELKGVAAGTSDNSAATVGQLKPVVSALGGGAAVNSDGTIKAPTYKVQGKTSNDVGTALNDLDAGLTNVQGQLNSAGLGLVAQDGGATAPITVGSKTGGTVVNFANKDGVARTLTNVADGQLTATSLDAVNGSQLFKVGSGLATAIGGGAALNPDGSITQPTFNVGGTQMHNVGDALLNIDGRVGANSTDITNIKQTLNNLGTGGGSGNPNAVAYDSSAHDKVTLGAPGSTTTTLTNLTDGNLANGSTDAVTGNQLYATNQHVNALDDAIKNIGTTGNTGIAMGPVADGGTPTTPIATGTGSLAIGDGASATGDDSYAAGHGAKANGKDSTALGHNAQATGDSSVALGANSVADEPNTVSIGSEGNERRLTNVAPGVNGTDAVNMNQLGAVQSGLNDVARKSYGGIAAATALTMIPDVDANKTLSIGIGGGTYKGYAATAIGGTARITQNIKVRVGAGWSSSGTTVGAGASYQW